MLLAGIFPAKRTRQKLVECPEFHLPKSEPIETPSETITISLLESSKKIAKYYGDVTLVYVWLLDTGSEWSSFCQPKRHYILANTRCLCKRITLYHHKYRSFILYQYNVFKFILHG
jgi:hypothetical protein